MPLTARSLILSNQLELIGHISRIPADMPNQYIEQWIIQITGIVCANRGQKIKSGFIKQLRQMVNEIAHRNLPTDVDQRSSKHVDAEFRQEESRPPPPPSADILESWPQIRVHPSDLERVSNAIIYYDGKLVKPLRWYVLPSS